MADYSGQTPPDSTTLFAGWRLDLKNGEALADVGAVTTYYYVTSGGVFGSTTDPSAVPAGAGILRVVTA